MWDVNIHFITSSVIGKWPNFSPSIAIISVAGSAKKDDTELIESATFWKYEPFEPQLAFGEKDVYGEELHGCYDVED